MQVSVARGRMCDWLWNGACLETPDWPSYCLKESPSGSLPGEAVHLQRPRWAGAASMFQRRITASHPDHLEGKTLISCINVDVRLGVWITHVA